MDSDFHPKTNALINQPTRLSFDSSLFGYPVGKTQVNGYWNEREFLGRSSGYQLVYIFSAFPLEIIDAPIQLVDTKLTYRKSVSGLGKMPTDIARYSGPLTDQLIDLALESGRYSRFKTDPRLTQNEFQKLYTHWIKNAWESNTILAIPGLKGMLSYRLEGKSASVDLIAVSKENQGQGWGKQLMADVGYYAAQEGANEIRVSTQETNLPARKLYESQGYRLTERMQVYHYWRP